MRQAAIMAIDKMQFVERVKATRVLTAEQQSELAKMVAGRGGDVQALAKDLIQRGWLTEYQVKRIIQGHGDELGLGPYVLLDLIGEGGMGRVFKARHPLMDRVVALKLIRPDRLSSPETIQRFEREIKAAAKLVHPNVVIVHDASRVGDRHFYVMEFVPGADLAKVVAKNGPLAVAEAADYVRQAALGLQHAHEHGLIHRDIKPGNLMLVSGGVVSGEKFSPHPSPLTTHQIKILDLGLARLRPSISQATPGDELTQEGALMGTPDYMAPEQGIDAASADIRADIYSLGCTLYFLLTGRPPFPGGSLAQKLNWHQQAAPAAIETVRRDVPPGLAAVVQRMLAKKPEQRYQTPAEVAQALTPFCADAARGAQGSTITYAADSDTARSFLTAHSRKRGWLIGTVAALLLVGLGLLAFFLWPRGRGPNADGKVEVLVRLAGIAKPADAKTMVILLDGQPIAFESLQQEIKLKIGPHELVIEQEGGARERREFVVGPEHGQQKIVLPETDLPVGLITSLSGHQFEVTSVSFSADGLRLLSVGPNGNDGVFLWDVPSAKQMHHYAPKNRLIKQFPWCGALSPDGHAALIGTHTSYKGASAKPWVQIVGMESGIKRWDSSEHTRKLTGVAFSADGKRALSADDAGFAKVWDAATGKKEFQLDGNVGCFSPEGERVLTAYKLRAELWQLADPPKKLQSFEGHSENIRGVAFAPDGGHVLTCGDATAKLWDTNTGKMVRLFKGHDKEVTSAAISPDGRRVLTGSKDSTVRLWDTATGNQLLSFTDHTDAVTSVAYSPGGRRAASGSLDRSVRLWSLPK